MPGVRPDQHTACAAYSVEVDPRIRTRIVTVTLLAIFALVLIGTLLKHVH